MIKAGGSTGEAASTTDDNTRHETAVEDTQEKILRELKLIRIILGEAFGIEINKGDLNE